MLRFIIKYLKVCFDFEDGHGLQIRASKEFAYYKKMNPTDSHVYRNRIPNPLFDPYRGRTLDGASNSYKHVTSSRSVLQIHYYFARADLFKNHGIRVKTSNPMRLLW